MTLANQWLGTLSYRWYESGRHFGGIGPGGAVPGDQENKALNDDPVNQVHSFDVSATYKITKRWSATLTLPFIDADRTSTFEHPGGGGRHTMHAGGLGDVRAVTEFWLLDPHRHMDGNIALGIGFKAPTGDDKASDISYRFAPLGGPTSRPVDQSIQPGDGGWGVILQLQAYQKIYKNLYGYAQGSYMLTPEEHNQTQTVNGDILVVPGVPRDQLSVITLNSISDQYFGRAGFSYLAWPSKGMTVSIGGRVEGVPVYDAIGGSLGFRQPGYTVSIEPGITWMGQRNSFSLLAPVALYRNRERSAPEILLNRPALGASFADFSILASFTHRF